MFLFVEKMFIVWTIQGSFSKCYCVCNYDLFSLCRGLRRGRQVVGSNNRGWRMLRDQ